MTSRSVTGLIMAGGLGLRMARSGALQAKPLVPILGVPLVERNLQFLLRAGVAQVVVSVSRERPEVGDFARGRLAEVAATAGAELVVVEDPQPLGNIGPVTLVPWRDDDVLVVYADNLTTLDLVDLIGAHRERQAVCTLAVHTHPFQVPYGRLEIRDGLVTAYEEKPTMHVQVCSAVAVLSPDAVAVLPQDRPVGLVDMFALLSRAGHAVHAYEHAACWVDVNDTSAVSAAESLVSAHEALFESAGQSHSRRLNEP